MSARSVLLAFAALVLSTASTPSSRSSAAVDGGRGRLRLTVVDEQGRNLVSRVQILPNGLGERVRLGAFQDMRQVARKGSLSVSLPEGGYLVRVSRGIEWSLSEFGVRIEDGADVQQRVVLSHQVHVPGYEGADLHVHTEHSDDAVERGGVGSADLLAEGVALAAVTDHNRIGTLDADLEAVVGAEITTWAPEVGHFNAFPLTKVPAHRNTTPEALAKELAAQPGVFLQVNHPRLQDHIAYFELGGFDGANFRAPGFHLKMDGLEVYNGYDLRRPREVRKILGEYRRWLARGHRLTATGGSDSHGPRGHLPGYPRTYAAAAKSSELAPALKRGRAFVTNGPLMTLRVNGRGMGESAHVTNDRAQVEVSVQAADWLSVEQLEIWADDQLLLTAAIPKAATGKPLRFELRRSLHVRGARVITAVAHGGRGLERLFGHDVTPLAFTNPVYLRHDVLAASAD